MQAYVYIVFDRDAVPRCVGKGKGNRWRAHRSASHNKELARIVKESDGELPIVIVRQGLPDGDAYDLEVALIAAIGRGDCGPLLNLSNGGEGVGSHTPETKAKLSALKKGKPVGKRPEITRARMRAAHLGKKHSAAHAAAIGSALKGRTYKPETIERMREGALKRVRPPHYSADHKAAIQAGLKRFWDQRRQLGLPLRHPGSGKGAI